MKSTVVAKSAATQLDQNWLSKGSSPFVNIDKNQYFREIIEVCKSMSQCLKRLRQQASEGGPGMVLVRKEDTDARLSMINDYGNSYFTVFSAKIDHCMWVADGIYLRIQSRFNL